MKKLLMSLFVFVFLAVGIQAQASWVSDAVLREIVSLRANLGAEALGSSLPVFATPSTPAVPVVNPTVSDTDVCCESFGYGANMIKTSSTFGIVPKSKCILPIGSVGGAKNIVSSNLCTSAIPVSTPTISAPVATIPTTSDIDVCCESFGYGANMIRTSSTFGIVPKSKCVLPVGSVGGAKNIVSSNLCTSAIPVSTPTISAPVKAVPATPVVDSTTSIMRSLKVGMKGDDVKALQTFLGLTPDGSFGKITAAKVKEWQKSKGLVSDGIFGKISVNKMSAE